MAYETRPDSGALFTNNKKTSDKAPDLRGDAVLSPELVRHLAGLVNSKQPAKIRIAVWSKATSKGDKFLSLKLEADAPRQGAANASSDEVPF
jgi:uncharacterized protein (DUF736 family)